MKKGIVLLTTITMLLICSIPATAETKFYFEKMVSGTIDEEYHNDQIFDTDSTVNIIGIEWAGKRFLFRGEMGEDTLKIPQKVDFSTKEFLMGIRLINKRRFKWNLDYCYQSAELEDTTEQFSGSMLGTEFVWGTKKSNLSFLFLLPLDGTSKDDAHSNVGFLTARLKYCYLFNETIGMSLGYRFDSVSWEQPGRYFDSTEWAEIARQGVMLGLYYQF